MKFPLNSSTQILKEFSLLIYSLIINSNKIIEQFLFLRNTSFQINEICFKQ